MAGTDIQNRPPYDEPLVTMGVKAADPKDTSRLTEVLREMTGTDPVLEHGPASGWGTTVLRGQSVPELDDALSRLRKQVKVLADEPRVMHRVTVREAVSGATGEYVGKSAQVRVVLDVEPLEGDGPPRLEFVNKAEGVSADHAGAFQERLWQFPGREWPLGNVRVTLAAGSSFQFTGASGGTSAIARAAFGALESALGGGNSRLLEPWVNLTVTAPQNPYEGLVASCLNSRDALIMEQQVTGENVAVRALAPLSQLHSWDAYLSQRCDGKATSSMTFHSFQAASAEQQQMFDDALRARGRL
ncbi:hypothetical protein [Streptomyces virginiae]|uniref:hypothetical protein n=1 Tax=Streptomyces virginiae TaxID=1961 RepID=UPI00345DBB2E